MTTAQYKKQYTTILQYVYIYICICTNINIHIMHMTKTAAYKNNIYIYETNITLEIH